MAWKSRCAWGIATLTGAAWVLSGCLAGPSSPPEPVNVAAGLQAESAAYPADHPAALALADDGRVFYTEKNTGQIRVIKDGTLLAEPFASVPVNSAGERGLLGIALHPRFQDNGRIYVFYTRSDTGLSTDDPQAVVDHRVVYFTEDETTADVSTGAETFVVSLPAGTATSRISGVLGFAPDRTLLVALGDFLDADAAQDANVVYGKILRYNDDGSIPADNPQADSAVYALGFREPRGLAFDPDTGYPFITERGANGVHAIDRIQSGSNYGWPIVVGFADTLEELAFVAEHPEYGEPVAVSSGQLVGGSFNPSAKYGPSWLGEFFYGANDSARILALELTTARTAPAQTTIFASSLPTPMTAVAFTPAGTLYVACEDAVLRIVLFE